MLFFSRKQWQLLVRFEKTPAFSRTQRSNYVDVKMKWKNDPFFDSLDILTKGRDLRPLVSLKNIIAQEPDGYIPISAISKRGRELEISGRVASFLRWYPAIFEEFAGPKYNLPWFKLTEEVAELDIKKREVYETRRLEIVDRLRRLILMSREERLPLRIVQGMLWYLGLPEDFFRKPKEISKGCFRIVELEDEEQGLSTKIDRDEPVLSALQRIEMKKLNGTMESLPSTIAFPLFPSKGLLLKQKIGHWLEEFQELPYVSPYEDFSHLDPSSDILEKQVAGVLHELLSLFVDNSGERRRLLCLKKHLGLPQKFHKAFECHPHVFYLLLKNKTCFVVLKEAYYARSATTIEKHPMLEVRKKYVGLMNKSEAILRSRRSRKPLGDNVEEGLDAAVNSENKEDYDGLDEGMEGSL